MVNIGFILFLCAFIFTGSVHAGKFRWEQGDDSLALVNNGKEVWRSNHKIGEYKPSIHPLSLVDGTALTAFRPVDHTSHRGLWFAWKFINGVNYWDEGYNAKSEGITDILSVQVKRGFLSRKANISMDLGYRYAESHYLMTEKRKLSFSKPRRKGYWVEWESFFTVVGQRVALDRIAIPGEPGQRWDGGYAGLNLRATRECIGWQFRNSSGITGARAHGQPARWMAFSGSTINGKRANIVIFDHPDNPRHPSCWYISEKMPLFSPAILYGAPLLLKPGEQFSLKYMIFVHEGTLSDEDMLNIWSDWIKDD